MPRRPNILLILTDQHNPHIAGYAGDRRAHTEALDGLAEKSVRFDAAYCQTPLCVPSRISMLTGKYAHRCSAWNNSSILYPHELTLPQHLSAHGYTTALVGKMHLRGPKWMGGFDYRPYGDLVVDRFCFHQPDPPYTSDGRWCNHEVGRFAWAGETQIPESLLGDGVVTRESLAFLLEHADRYPDKPWFLCAGYGRPHFPFTAPGRYMRRHVNDPAPLPARPEGYPINMHPHDRFIVDDFHLYNFADEVQLNGLAAYYACVDYVDDCIGELLAGLANAGILDSTYVVYASDHGEMSGEHGMWSKRSYYEASVRIPLLISGPDISGGQTASAPVELLDLFPTFCDLAGVPIPNDLDGESLAPILDGRPQTRKKGDARCEMLGKPDPVMFRMARDEQWKYVEFPEFGPVLFDMINDPGENTNLLSAGAAPAGCPIEELRLAASDGVSWDEILCRREEETARRPKTEPGQHHGPVQYQLTDGRTVDGDAFLYDVQNKGR